MRTLALTIALSMVLVVPTLDADHPNIVFIMSDDHAAHAIGAYGSRVNQTPNLDRLAREGALLEEKVVSRLGAPEARDAQRQQKDNCTLHSLASPRPGGYSLRDA